MKSLQKRSMGQPLHRVRSRKKMPWTKRPREVAEAVLEETDAAEGALRCDEREEARRGWENESRGMRLQVGILEA